ncbi:MAG: LD-carboxypeptidase [Bacteroidales bacterium]|jgi:muramoyltetrapeptide carboxypeptidase|nr:LD-carboxypeptidase [Bacteroidales bacterium]
MSQRAEFIKPKSKVAIVTTARKISIDDVLPMKRRLESWGLEVVLGKTINTNAEFQLADTDAKRAEDLQAFLDAKDISAIFCAKGGYGTARIIEMLDFSAFVKYPKWIAGFSDVTVLLSHLYSVLDYQSIHGTMSIDIKDNTSANAPSVESLKRCIFGELTPVKWKANELNIKGKCNGEVLCGNLSVLYSLLGSVSFGSTDGKILVIEDLDEYIYHIDRMMIALKRSGKLSNLAGLVVGSFSDMHDNTIPFDRRVNDIIIDVVKDYNYPLCFDFPLGHIGESNTAIINGAFSTLEITTQGCTLQQF